MSTILSARAMRARKALAAAAWTKPFARTARAAATVTLCGALLGAASAFQSQPAAFIQQGVKLVGSGVVGSTAFQGASVALSADGTTAIVGAIYDNFSGSGGVGAVWVFTRSAGVWTQQQKLIGTGNTGVSDQGWSVALSSDGNTAIVGGSHDNSSAGAVWIFTRSSGVWSQQAGPLTGTGATGPAGANGSSQGASVALSADGNTAVVGGPKDQLSIQTAGAVWIWTRNGSAWSQQGSKLVPSNPGNGSTGWSVALSADGNTLLTGAPTYCPSSPCSGAAFVFTRTSGVWSQQAGPLIGSGAVGSISQGEAVALSADGNTAIVGAREDSNLVGAVWAWTRSGGTWAQQGTKLVPSGWVPQSGSNGPSFGYSLGLSADGSTAVVGGWGDNGSFGATWIFAQSGGIWTQRGSKLVGTGAAGAANQGISVAISPDGNTVIEGGYGDNSGIGAAWVFVPYDLTAAPSSGQAPLAVSFNAFGLIPPMTYTMNFGDGTTGSLSQLGGCLSPPPVGTIVGGGRCSGVASHTYSNPGTYTATLLNASSVAFGTATVTVGAAIPNARNGWSNAAHR